ncbi:MAG TPA: divalent-cation tolerance protein CutA [Polyangiaceae bacterium]|nr:divalent-cation tolerance protein CutA [Polyangiaceae bacterium]
MSTQPAIVILCTAPAEGQHAERLARGLVEARLAACVNLLPNVRSFYAWQGALHDDAEVQLVIKTRPEAFDKVEAWIHEHHPYEVPEVIALPVTAVADPYAAWIASQVPA